MRNGVAKVATRSIAVFDLGGVLVDWNPRYLFRKLFDGDDVAMERFLTDVCGHDWNLAQDAGRPFAEACALLADRHPAQRHLIEAYHQRWPEMLGGPIDGTVDILRELKERGTPLYALTNWSAETFPIALGLYDFLHWFEGTVVSGVEKLVKPDSRIYRLLLERYGIDPADAVYIDDNKANAGAAAELGLHGIHFTGPDALRDDLECVGLL
jgi:2-haloacid dehalogenase